MHVGQLIERIAKERRMTQKEIADGLNKVASAVGHLYKRETVDSGILMKLSEILDYDFFKALSTEKGETPSANLPAVHEDPERYGTKTDVPVMVKLDGTEATLNMWLQLLTRINQAV